MWLDWGKRALIPEWDVWSPDYWDLDPRVRRLTTRLLRPWSQSEASDHQIIETLIPEWGVWSPDYWDLASVLPSLIPEWGVWPPDYWDLDPRVRRPITRLLRPWSQSEASDHQIIETLIPEWGVWPPDYWDLASVLTGLDPRVRRLTTRLLRPCQCPSVTSTVVLFPPCIMQCRLSVRSPTRGSCHKRQWWCAAFQSSGSKIKETSYWSFIFLQQVWTNQSEPGSLACKGFNCETLVPSLVRLSSSFASIYLSASHRHLHPFIYPPLIVICIYLSIRLSSSFVSMYLSSSHRHLHPCISPRVRRSCCTSSISLPQHDAFASLSYSLRHPCGRLKLHRRCRSDAQPLIYDYHHSATVPASG